MERFLDPELLRKSGYDKLKIVTGGADHSVSAIVREVAAKLNIPCLVGDGWGVVGSHFYRACDIVAQYGDTGDSWCKQQEEDFRRTKPENPFHLLF
ncbi:MAG TPA: hypothetical protein VD907_06350 [Verrucomicrobiae bacterium]|nr:hypothetical protein [Verrucomicrobiae bacterium]